TASPVGNEKIVCRAAVLVPLTRLRGEEGHSAGAAENRLLSPRGPGLAERAPPMRSSTLPVEVVLMGGVGAIVLGLCLLLSGRRWRARHGNTAALVVLLGLLAAAGLTALTGSAGLALLPLGLAGLWGLGWVGRTGFGLTCLRRASALPGSHH